MYLDLTEYYPELQNSCFKKAEKSWDKNLHTCDVFLISPVSFKYFLLYIFCMRWEGDHKSIYVVLVVRELMQIMVQGRKEEKAGMWESFK